MSSVFDVKDRTILITGASRGIGRALAHGFKEAGAIVYGVGSKPESVSWMEKEGIYGRVADISQAGTVDPIIEEIQKTHGRLHCLINNAGIATNIPASAFKDDDIDKMINTNFLGTFRTCKAYYKTHKKVGGVVVNVSSVLGLFGYTLSSIYSGTKGAVIQLTKSLAAEWVGSNFRLNAICPGFFDTDMTNMLKKKPQLMEQFNQKLPMKRMGKPEELLGAAIFLASDASSYMTGQVIVVDGGVTSIIQ